VGLPTIDYFNLSLPDDANPKSVVEMGRFIVHPRHRGKSRIISIGLSLLLKSYMRNDTTLEWLVAFMSDDARRSFHAFVPFRVLDELPLETKHLNARESLPGYWAKGRIRPVIARSSELL